MTEQIDRPLLRVLKCAAKLHRAGLTLAETVQYINNCRWYIEEGGGIPSAALTPYRIVWASFVWKDSVEGHDYWKQIAWRLGEAQC